MAKNEGLPIDDISDDETAARGDAARPESVSL